MSFREPVCFEPATPKPKRRPLDAAHRARVDRLLSAFRARLEQAAAEGRSGEVHLVAELRDGQLTAGSRINGPNDYPLRG